MRQDDIGVEAGRLKGACNEAPFNADNLKSVDRIQQ